MQSLSLRSDENHTVLVRTVRELASTMESAAGPGRGASGVPLTPEALLVFLRPYCMATMVALEGILGAEGDTVG